MDNPFLCALDNLVDYFRTGMWKKGLCISAIIAVLILGLNVAHIKSPLKFFGFLAMNSALGAFVVFPAWMAVTTVIGQACTNVVIFFEDRRIQKKRRLPEVEE